MKQTELKKILEECGNVHKLSAVKAVLDYLNQKEKVIGLKEAKELVDKYWGAPNQGIPTDVVGLMKEIRNYNQPSNAEVSGTTGGLY